MRSAADTKTIVLQMFVVFLLMFVSSGIACAQVTTIDPNAVVRDETEEEDAPENILDADERLDVPITMHAKHEAATEVIKTLVEKSGVKLMCGRNSHDRYSRARRMNIFVTDVPLRDVMQSMARVLNCKWKVTRGEDETYYRFIFYDSALDGLPLPVPKDREEFEKYVFAERKKTLDLIEKKLPLDVLEEKYPALWVQEKMGRLDFVRSLFYENPELKDFLLYGSGEKKKKLDNIGPQSSARLYEALQGAHDFYNKIELRSDSVPKSWDDSKARAKRGVLIELQSVDELWQESQGAPPGYDGLFDFGYVSLYENEQNMGAFRFQTSSSKNLNTFHKKMFVEPYLLGVNAMEYTQGLRDAGVSILDVANEERESDFDYKKWHDASVEQDHDEFVRPAKVLETVAGAASINIISDSFSSGQKYPGPAKGEKKAGDIVKTLVEKCHYDYRETEKVAEFEYDKWHTLYDAQIPKELTDKWMDELKTTRLLSFDSMIEVAGLDFDEYLESIRPHEFFSKAPYNSVMSFSREEKDFVKFYQSLTTAQKAQLKEPVGLAIAGLSAEQVRFVEKTARLEFREQWQMLKGVREQLGIPEVTEDEVVGNIEDKFLMEVVVGDTQTGVPAYRWDLKEQNGRGMTIAMLQPGDIKRHIELWIEEQKKDQINEQ